MHDVKREVERYEDLRLEHPDMIDGRIWTHIKSRALYRIVCPAMREDDLAWVVVYRRVHSGLTYTRPLNEFLERFRVVTIPPAKEEA